MRRFSVMKKESSITRDIKLKAESLHRRLDALSKQVQRTEDQLGPNAVTTRIQLSQHASLHSNFQQVEKMTLPILLYFILHYITYNLAETFIQSGLTIGAKTIKNQNTEQQGKCRFIHFKQAAGESDN